MSTNVGPKIVIVNKGTLREPFQDTIQSQTRAEKEEISYLTFLVSP